MENGFHQPVLLQPSVQYLITRSNGIYVDCTVGGGGHSRAFLEHAGAGAFLVGIDADADALKHASEKLSGFSNFYFSQQYYDQLEIVLYEAQKFPVDGIFYDLGVSSYQLDAPDRGFTFRSEAPLDMRMDVRQQVSAADVVNTYSREELGAVIRNYGEERHWRAITRDIVARRTVAPLETTRQLAEIVKGVVGERHLNKSLARVFQALRIEVNHELTRLTDSLEAASRLLRKGGRLVVISYHSLEDRIVKNFMKEKSRSCVCPPGLPVCVCGHVQELKRVTRRALLPDEDEIAQNPRARSARMRVAEKLVDYEEAA